MSNVKGVKCLFVYDNKYQLYNSSFYTAGKVTDEVFKFFVETTDSMTAITRVVYIGNNENLSKIRLKNIKFKPVKGLSFSKIFSVYVIYNFKLIFNEIKGSDYMVVRLPSFLGIASLVLNITLRKPYFIEVVGDAQNALLLSVTKPSIYFKIFTYTFFKLNQYFIKNADGVIYVTKDFLQKKYPTNGYESYASDVEINIASRELKQEQYINNKNFFKIGMIGDYNNHYKGIKEAIQAVKILNSEGYNTKLHILGSGSLKKYYMDLAKNLKISNLISFDGRLNGHNEVLNWLGTLDIYIQPSYTEGLPRSLIEAMSIGLPIVASDVGGIPELLDNTDLVASHDAKALAYKIELLTQSTQTRFEKGNSNYEKSKQYSKKILTQQRQNFWKNCRNIVQKIND